MLATIRPRLVDLKQNCPQCDRQTLAGTYHADTNTTENVHCINTDCNYSEED